MQYFHLMDSNILFIQFVNTIKRLFKKCECNKNSTLNQLVLDLCSHISHLCFAAHLVNCLQNTEHTQLQTQKPQLPCQAEYLGSVATVWNQRKKKKKFFFFLDWNCKSKKRGKGEQKRSNTNTYTYWPKHRYISCLYK